MASLNKVILIGHMVADPELKQTTSGVNVCSFTIGVSRRYTKSGEQAQTDFLDIVAWRQQADFVARYFRKGSAICICGSLQKRAWDAKDGTKRYAVEVVADEINFVERKSDSGRVTDEFGAPPPAPAYNNGGFGGGYSGGATAAAAPQFEEIAGDDDLPF